MILPSQRAGVREFESQRTFDCFTIDMGAITGFAEDQCRKTALLAEWGNMQVLRPQSNRSQVHQKD